jgi:hypothetical protein
MKKAINWIKSFKDGFVPNIEFRFLGILQIFIGYYKGEDGYFMKMDGCDTRDLTSVSFSIWKFGIEIILNKHKDDKDV